jgi:ADP-heptose:LPS heptosyltransferase
MVDFIYSKHNSMHKKYNKLVWLPTGGHIGDAIMIMSLFGEMSIFNPSIQIFYLVRRNFERISELSEAYPNVRVIHLPQSPIQALQTVLPLLFKKTVLLTPPPRGPHPIFIKILAFIFKLRGNPVLGFKDKGEWQPFNKVRSYDRSTRYIDNLRKAVNDMGFITKHIGEPPQLIINPCEIKEFPFKNRAYIAVHPFPHMATFKTLPLKRWKELLKKITTSYPDCGIVITGAEVDREQAEELSEYLGGNKIFLGIDLPLQQVAYIFKNCSLYLGVDTGPTHLAGVMHVPSIILAQQNEPVWLPDYNPNATLIWSKENCVCGRPGEVCDIEEEGKIYRRCVYYIKDEDILSALAKLI